MKLLTAKCRQLPIVGGGGEGVGGDICGVDTDAEKEMKSEGAERNGGCLRTRGPGPPCISGA